MTDAATPDAAVPGRDHPGHRLRALDAIRGIAALLVVLGHGLEKVVFFLPDGVVRTALAALVVDYLNFGRTGVIAFFMLSGYVIPFSFSHRRPIPSFFITRFFRLFPAYWLSVALAVPVMLFYTGAWPSAGQVLANLTMVQQLLGQEDLIGVYWTLFYELLFYGLCVVAFLAGRMESPRYLLGVVATLCFAGLGAALLRHSGMLRAVPIGIPMFLSVMHLGTLARLNDRGDGATATRCYRIALALVLLTSGPIAGLGFIQRTGSETLFSSVSSLYVGYLLFLGLRHSQAICRPWLLFLGLVSYSLYLFHPLLLLPIIKYTQDPLAPASAGVAFLLFVPGLLAGGIALAALVQRYVEKPANQYGKALRHRLLARP